MKYTGVKSEIWLLWITLGVASMAMDASARATESAVPAEEIIETAATFPLADETASAPVRSGSFEEKISPSIPETSASRKRPPQRRAPKKIQTIPMPEGRMPQPLPPPKPSWGKRILWYVPNRVMDLLDIFRLRVRAGPGLSANFRMTDYGAFYWGKYNTVYLGLPGPRYPYILRSPVGFESLNGMILAGVDATDDTRHGPQYGPSEVDIGFNLLVVGAEAGIDPVEIGDFVGGLFFFDFRGDDYPRKAPDLPVMTSGLALGEGSGMFQVGDKPERFDSLSARLDYLHTNVQRRVSEPLRATDMYFAEDKETLIVPPQTQMRLGLYTVFTEDRGLNFEFSPDIQLDVELPNLEQRMRIFVETARDNALPGTYTTDQEDQGINVGARKRFDNLHLSLDAGVRSTWLPEAFVRLIWSYEWIVGKWSIRPDERIFYQGGDGLGAMSSLYINRWLGESNIGLLNPTASAKYTSDSDTLSWSLNLDAVRVPELLDESRRGKSFAWKDAAWAQGLRYSAFGSHGVVDKQRISLGFRGPLYKKWIYWELDPGLEWNRDSDYETGYVIRMGIDLLFWGKAHG